MPVRRNLDRADRDEMIRRLAARGVKQKNIAEKTGLSKGRITQIVSESNSLEVKHESSINTTTPAAEIASLQRKLEEAEAARRSTEQRLSAVQSVPSSRFGSPKLASPRRLKVE